MSYDKISVHYEYRETHQACPLRLREMVLARGITQPIMPCLLEHPDEYISDPGSAGTSPDGARREGEGQDIGKSREPLQPHGLRAGRQDIRGGILADD